MSCSAPGTNRPPEMKTVRNRVLLRLSLALFFRLPQGDHRTFVALPQQTHARSPRDHHLASTPPARAAQERWTRNPESCPHGLSGEEMSRRKPAARGPVVPPRPPQRARPLPMWPKPPTPSSCPPSILCTHRRVGCPCLLFSCYPAHLRPVVYKSFCRKNHHIYGTPEGVGIHKKAVSLCGWQRAGKALN